jgi:hypothetical protein
MKTIFLLLVVCCALAAAQPQSSNNSQGTPPPSAVTQDDAVNREKELFAADQKHDLDKIRSIVADDFVDIARDGSSIGKEALLKEIPTLKLLKYAQSNWEFHSFGPYAYAISYDSDATMIREEKEARSQNHLNSVWIYRSGRWQMLLHSRGGAGSK